MTDDSPNNRWILRNLTPNILKIDARSNEEPVLQLAPFEEDTFPHHVTKSYPIKTLESRGIVLSNNEKEVNQEHLYDNLFRGVAIFGFFLFVILKNLAEEQPQLAIYTGTIILIISLLAVIAVGVTIWKGSTVIFGWLQQALSLILILSIAAGLPIYVYYNIYGTGQNFTQWILSTNDISTLLQLLFTIVLCLLPALLYFLFDRQLLGTLRDRFEQSIFRLDDSLHTLRDVHAKYGRRLEEVFGAQSDQQHEARIARGTRIPIFIATIVITLGWLWVFIPDPTSEAIIATAAFAPPEHALIYAFLGAYFFTIGTIVRRYIRGDLKPKAYSSITVRILLALIGAWVLDIMFSGNFVLIVAFIVGFFPETLIVLINEYLRKRGIEKSLPSVKQRHPLTELEGIDVYDRTRLQDEGIVNIESLAHHDLIELMLETRIPLQRLIDWVDQAILFIHLSSLTENSEDGGNELRMKLKRSGIRTATSLDNAFNLVACLANQKAVTGDTGLIFNVKELAHIGLVLEALSNDDWLASLQHWRKTSQNKINEIYIDSEGNDKEDTNKK